MSLFKGSLAGLGEATRHPFDVLTANNLYRAHKRLLGLQLRQRQLKGEPGLVHLRLPMPYGVKPPVVS